MIEEVEKLRKKARNIVILGILFFAVLTIVLAYNDRYGIGEYAFILVPFLGIVITKFIIIKPKKEFLLAFKKTFVLNSLQMVFTDLKYDPNSGIDESIIFDAQIMNMGDRYSSNDYISGRYKNINVIQSDVLIEKETRGSNDRKSWVTLFKGRWMIFDFNKSFKANVQVTQKGFTNSKVSIFKYKKVMMEDQKFNDKFKVYAQNELDAFYILTPSLMEKIENLADSINGKILLCFIDNKLHVGIQNNKDSFEHSIFIKINVDKVNDKISRDIKLITNFIDELDLDNDLFRKEV